MKPKNIKRLIPLSDYVLENQEDHINPSFKAIKFDKIQEYTKFLKQPLELSFFIPCDENGSVLQPVIQMDYFNQIEGYRPKYPQECYKTDLEQYNKAKEQVLFKGVECQKSTYYQVKRTFYVLNKIRVCTILEYPPNGKITKTFCIKNKYKTIEDLVHLNLELC